MGTLKNGFTVLSLIAIQPSHVMRDIEITGHPCIPGEEEAEGEEFICLMGL